ncbi:MAG: hypothetical protein H7Y11_04375 [Armatimonadetes bacterium]|nr:hypothetical protein [Anaerolineae bacterium]
MIKRLCWLLVLGGLAGCNLMADTTTPTPPATPDVPQVAFNAPPNRVQVFDGVLMDLDIVAQDTTAGIARVELYVDGELHTEGEPEVPPTPLFRVSMNWYAQGVGFHTLTAVAYRPDDTPSQEATIVVEVVART